jgi:hypothetical protein
MTINSDDDLKLRNRAIGTAKSENAGVNPNGFDDPTGQYPKREYVNKSTINQTAVGQRINKVYTGGGDHNLSLDLPPLSSSQYTLNQVKETVSGHIIEYDDTPGNERIMLRHRTGAGVEMRADGTVIISSTRNTVRVTGGDEKVIVEGDGQISYNGNLTLNVTGDFDLVVGGNFNVKTSGDRIEDTTGSYLQKVHKNHKTVVTKNKSNFIGETFTETVLGNTNTITKGKFSNLVEGNVEFFSGNDVFFTAERNFIQSASNMNLAAKSMTVIGDSGTIGGHNIINYFYNAYGVSALFKAGVQAPCFIGDLTGKADEANQADFSTTAGQAPLGAAGSPGTNTHVNRDTRATVEPIQEILDDYLHATPLGIRDINIDVGGIMKKVINRSEDYNGISDRDLNIYEIRSKMRDPNTINNTKFIGTVIAEGKLSSSYVNPVPPSIGRIVGPEPIPRRGKQTLGNRGDTTKRFIS